MNIVLTGGPGSGKTTLLEHFRAAGHPVVTEAAMRAIEELVQEMGMTARREWRRSHVLEFQQRILELQVQQEEQLKGAEAKWRFLDRGRLDGLGYMQLAGVKPPPEMLRRLMAGSYECVFSLDTLPGFHPREETGRMTESREDSSLIQRTIAQLYRAQGYRVLTIPVMSLADRASYITSQLAARPSDSTPGGGR